MLLSLFPIEAANTLIMPNNNRIALDLPDLQDQNSFILCWCSFSELGSQCVALCFAYEVSQYRIYEWRQPMTMQITNDARTKIVDALLMLILPFVYPHHVII